MKPTDPPVNSTRPERGKGLVLPLSGVLPASILGGAWTAWTPALTAVTTNPTLGTGSSAAGRYSQFGKLVIAQAKIIFGTSGVVAGSGVYFVSLPVTPLGSSQVCGSFMLFDSDAGAFRAGTIYGSGTIAKAELILGAGPEVGDAAPWVWAASDQIVLSFAYEAA